MTEFLRRLLWSLPLILLGEVLLFLMLGRTQPMQKTLELPLFYNARPQSAETEAILAMDLVLGDGPTAERGAARLVELGGAALPTVLQRLPSLPLGSRRKVANALGPLTARMGLSERNVFSAAGAQAGKPISADERLLFWSRYREEHALDLQPQAVARLVRRVQRTEGSVRHADLYAIDTYALPALVEALGRVRTSEDIERCKRLLSLITHMTGYPFELSAQPTIAEAETMATEVRWFFDYSGAKWSSNTPIERIVARVAQTEFAVWLSQLSRQVIGLDSRVPLYRLVSAGQVSLPFLAAALLGLLFVGPLLAAALLVVELSASRPRWQRPVARLALSTLLLLISFLLVKFTSPVPWKLWALSVGMGTALSVFVLERELGDRLDWRTHNVLSRRSLLERILAASRWLTPTLLTLTPLAVTEAATWTTVLELSSNTPGLGLTTIRALQRGDLYVLMLVGLLLAVLGGSAHILADTLRGTSLSERSRR